MTDTPTPPAGWYVDPEHPTRLRWWDGAAWTEHRHVPAPTSVTGVPVVPDAPPPDWASAPPPSIAGGPGGVASATRRVGLALAATVVTVWFASQVLSGLVVGGVMAARGASLEDLASLDGADLATFALVASAVSTLAVVGTLRGWLGRWTRVGGERAPSRVALLVGAGIGVAAPIVIGLLTSGLAVLLDLELPTDPSQELLAGLQGAGPGVAIVTGIAVVLLAPVVEELVFRRSLFAGLDSRWPTWVAVAVSAVLFAVVHTEFFAAGAFGLLQLLGLVLLGVVFAVLYARTRSVWPSVVAHGMFNLVGLVTVLVAT